MTPKEIKAEAKRRLREAGYSTRYLRIDAVIRPDMSGEEPEDDDTCDIHPLEDICERIRPGEVMDLYVYDDRDIGDGLIANVTYPGRRRISAFHRDLRPAPSTLNH
jgi:hypothetical protein